MAAVTICSDFGRYNLTRKRLSPRFFFSSGRVTNDPKNCIYLLSVLGLCCCSCFPLDVVRLGYSLFVVSGFSLLRFLLLRSTGSIVGVHTLSCLEGCRIFLDQGSNPCLLHWQADSLPLNHLGSPWMGFFKPKI